MGSKRKENSIEGYPPGINLAWKLMPGGNVMGGVPFLGVYLSVEPMIFTPVHPIMGFHLLDLELISNAWVFPC